MEVDWTLFHVYLQRLIDEPLMRLGHNVKSTIAIPILGIAHPLAGPEYRLRLDNRVLIYPIQKGLSLSAEGRRIREQVMCPGDEELLSVWAD